MADQRNILEYNLQSAPEVVPGDAPQRVPDEVERIPDNKAYPSYTDEQPRDKSRDNIWGLSPRVFWLLILLMVAILAGAIGGGVGGGLASRGVR